MIGKVNEGTTGLQENRTALHKSMNVLYLRLKEDKSDTKHSAKVSTQTEEGPPQPKDPEMHEKRSVGL